MKNPSKALQPRTGDHRNGYHFHLFVGIAGADILSSSKDIRAAEDVINLCLGALSGRLCVVGGIGLSSGTPQQDMICAQPGIDYFLQTQQQGAG